MAASLLRCPPLPRDIAAASYSIRAEIRSAGVWEKKSPRLEVYPQHVFRNKQGQKEQMAVGIAQNAIGDKLGYMSNPLSRGRSWHRGRPMWNPHQTPWGLNVAEQWSRALHEDPQVVFFTGWNEWTAMRFDTWAGWPNPGYPIFVDEFDPEHSRDIEPMRGGFGDAYYYQFVSYARRFKGARQPPRSGPPRTIDLQGGWAQWSTVSPSYYGCPGIKGSDVCPDAL